MPRFAPSSIAMAIVLTGAQLAHAQATDKAAAQALFDEGKRLMAAGSYAEACPKLAASQEADPGAGTLLNLAACYEKLGKTASAWVTYTDAATSADRSGHPDWAKRARAKAEALRPSLATLALTVPEPAPGLEVTRDGVAVSQGQWGSAIPVDPGPHEIEAKAPGKLPWHSQVEVGAAPASLTVPSLQDAPIATPPTVALTPVAPPPAAAHEHTGRTQRILGGAVAAVGVAGLAVGTVFGIRALSAKSSALDGTTHCNEGRTTCDAFGKSHLDDAGTFGTVSTVGLIAGGALVVGGAVLFFTAPKAKVPSMGFQQLPGGGLLTWRGTL